jgi:predicted ester cyclase
MNLLSGTPHGRLRSKWRPLLIGWTAGALTGWAGGVLFGRSRKSASQAGSSDLQQSDAVAYFREFWNGDPQAALRWVADEACMYGGDGEVRGTGPAEFELVRQGYAQAFSDLEVNIDEALRVGDTTILRWTARGVHTGSLRGIEGTGRPVTFHGAHILRTRDRQIIEERYFYDSLNLYEQVGAIQLPSQ